MLAEQFTSHKRGRAAADSVGRAVAPGETSASPFAPFHHTAFIVLWSATVLANVGTWIYNAGVSWLMTTLNSDPVVVSLVQVAASLPIFLFALPAGALADTLDKRWLLIAVAGVTTLLSALVASFVSLNIVTPAFLLLFTFLFGTAAALTMPTWQSIVPQLTPRKDLAAAVAANSVGLNIGRALGPAIAGLMIASFGTAAPFLLTAVGNLGIIGALLWWHPRPALADQLPAERLSCAIRTGVRHALYNPDLRATLLRAVAFFLFASAYWALLPLVVRHQVSGGPELYGILLGALGAGAVGGAFALPFLKAMLGPDRLVAVGTIGTAATLILFGMATEPVIAFIGSITGGLSWIAVLASLNVSAQVALPDWVRARGLSMFVTVYFGAMTIGSAIWGQVAGTLGLSAAHFIAAVGLLSSIPLTWRWKLQTGATKDLTPSMHWPAPVLAHDVRQDRGPVLVTVEYRIELATRGAFFCAVEELACERRRDGAYAWGIYEDAAQEGRFLETFLVESWLEHLHQHQRVTNADRVLQSAVDRCQAGGFPKITHFIAVRRRLGRRFPDRHFLKTWFQR